MLMFIAVLPAIPISAFRDEEAEVQMQLVSCQRRQSWYAVELGCVHLQAPHLSLSPPLSACAEPSGGSSRSTADLYGLMRCTKQLLFCSGGTCFQMVSCSQRSFISCTVAVPYMLYKERLVLWFTHTWVSRCLVSCPGDRRGAVQSG